MKRTICSLLSTISLSLSAQDTLPEQNLEEVLIYSNKFAERRKNIVQKIDVIPAQRIAQLNTQSTADLLIHTGNVFVQKSQQGGGSPVIRGFEASRVLLVIDGIRMNNAIYRAGHLQNIITIDQNMLERIEVLYGPASTLYGSDALGGVVHLRTKMPKLSNSDKTYFTGSALLRYSSANKEKTGHFDISIGGKKWAWLQSYNYGDFDDLRMGSRFPEKFPDFGRRPFYIATINGVDSIVKNTNDRIQRFSGYRQWDITQKLLFKPSEKVSHLLNLQYSNNSNIPRYDRLQDIRNGQLRFAEWYYGPQKRTLAAYELNVTGLGFFTEFRSILSYQHIEESRITREYRRYDRQDHRNEDLHVWNASIDGRKLWSRNELTVGADGQLNDLHSTAFRQNISTGAVSKLDTRYPNGSNNMNYAALYAQHLLKLNNGKLIVNDGVRLQLVSLHSTITDNSFFNFPFTEIEQHNTSITGNLGFVYLPDEQLRINGGFSSGFRAPNIDDLSRIFESNTASRQLIVPNPDIKPEYTYNADAGITKKFGNRMRVGITGFYTWFRNAITLTPFRLNGKDSILYNGTISRVFANQNAAKAYLYGFNADATFYFTKQLRLYSTFNYTYGRFINGNNKIPLDHIPPLHGIVNLLFTQKTIQAELYALYNGWKRTKDYNPSGEDNLQYGTPEGTPAWATINFKSTIRIIENLSVQAGVENIFDRAYRYFASGISAPGRNFIIALRSQF
ncbi:MAG: TonB-dependent receptor [Bacteroidota bacterium]|nr:TonB-dependent receptor [Bacteroidota bacterium]